MFVTPLGSFISYKFDDNANPKASAAVVSNGVSPPARSAFPLAVGNCVNVELANPKSAVYATVPLSFLNVTVLPSSYPSTKLLFQSVIKFV